MANYTTTITNEGAALLASVIANQGTLTFNEFRFSENDYTGQESTLTEGTFLGVFITASAAASVIDSTTIKASAQFNNSTITGNHDLYSIGIIGTDGNTTALIAVCTTTDPDVIREPLVGTSTYAFNVNLSVSDTSQITVTGTTAAVIYDIDVVDNLTSIATNKPLSANQGRVLKGNIDDNFSGQSNENLFDNPWFTINQRGASGIISGANVYGYDRWSQAGVGGGYSVTSDGPIIHITMWQRVEDNSLLQGKKATFTMLYADGEITSGTGTIGSTITTSDGSTLDFPTNQYNISAGNTNKAVRAVKLELGSVSTLANDVAPDYAFELAKCQTSKADPLDTYANQGEIAVTSQLSNRNLLDNPWFTVIQRGAITLSGGYGADRWKCVGGTSLAFSAGQVIMTNALCAQPFEDHIPNGTYTASVKLSDGSIYYGTATKVNDTDEIEFFNNNTFRLVYNYGGSGSKLFTIDNANVGMGTITVKAVKLEVGSVSTLHLDTEPNYITEYLKCRRYFKRFKGEFGIGCVREYDTSPINFLFRIKIPNDVPMRSDSPSVVVNGNIRIPDYAGVYTGSDLINVSGAKDSSVINMDIYSNSTLPVQPMAKGMAANVDVDLFGPDDGTLDLVDEL